MVREYSWVERKGRNGNFYAHSFIDGVWVSMHRFVLNAPKDERVVDHIDRDGLNNTRENLRLITNQQNCSRRISGRKANGLRGASRHHGGRQWVAQITAKGKRTYIGCFDTEIEASAAYFVAAKKYFGDFCPEAPAVVQAEIARLTGFISQ